MTTANTDTFAARIRIDGDTARRFRREALYAYQLCAERIDQAVRNDDMAALLEARADLAKLDDVLTDLGWDREIDDNEHLQLVGPAALLEDIARTFLSSSADALKTVAEGGAMSMTIDEALGDVQRWQGVLTQIRDTATGEDL